MANSYVDEMRLLNQNLAVSEASQRRLFYQQKLDAERDDLSKAELALEQAQEKSGLIQPQAQGQAIIDAVGYTAQAQVAAKEVQIRIHARTYATASNPDLKRAEQELAGLRDQLTRLERSKGALGNGEMAIPTRRLPGDRVGISTSRPRPKIPRGALRVPGQATGKAARIDEAKEAVVVQVLDKAAESLGTEVGTATPVDRAARGGCRFPAVLPGGADSGGDTAQAAGPAGAGSVGTAAAFIPVEFMSASAPAI